jgi:hypothetical protein
LFKYIELDADHPNAGDTLTMRVHMNGKLADEQTDKLDQPLEPNTAFFVQDHYDDYSPGGTRGGARSPAIGSSPRAVRKAKS